MNNPLIEQAIRVTLEKNSKLVSKWMEREPGSWGALAGKAVLEYRNEMGRKLTPDERRTVWHMLWAHLNKLKQDA